MVEGRDEPGLGRQVHRLAGDLTVLADGRFVLMTRDEQVHDLGDVLAALVGEERDRVPGTPWVGRGDRHLGRVRLTLEVLDRHERLNSEGMVVFGAGRSSV